MMTIGAIMLEENRLFADFGLDVALGIDGEGEDLDAAEPGGVVGGDAVVVEEIPLTLVLHDAVMGGPSHDGLEDDALIGEGSVRIVTHGIAQVMGVASAVGEIILAVHLVHPGSLEEAVRIAGLQRFAFLIDDDDGTGSLSELQHVVGHAGHAGGYGVLITFGQHGGTEILLTDRSGGFELVVAVPLQLTTPDATKIAVDLVVVVLEDAGVDAIGTNDGCGLRDEGTFGFVGHGHAKVEDTGVVLSGEDEIVLAVFLHHVIVPHLLLCPGHLIDIEDHAMVGDLTAHHVVHRQHVVVAHLEMATVVIETLAAVPVMAGIDIHAAVEHIGRGVGHIILRE